MVTEEPLQLLLDGAPLSVLMRTPGADIELALGLMFAEGIIRSRDEVSQIRISAEAGETDSRVPHRRLAGRVQPGRRPPGRRPASPAGAIDAVELGLWRLRDGSHRRPPARPVEAERRPQCSIPKRCPAWSRQLRSGQGVFERTGGLHAAGLFTPGGELICLREDVGRHNAVDKVVGRQLLDDRLPAVATVLVVSGRAGYEIVQKSISAGIPVLCAVGAPSSLAVALAREFNQTLVGFLRDERFNVYSAPERLAAS